MPPLSMWRMSAALAARFSVRSALRARGGTARTEAERSAGVTGCVFTGCSSSRGGPSTTVRTDPARAHQYIDVGLQHARNGRQYPHELVQSRLLRSAMGPGGRL